MSTPVRITKQDLEQKVQEGWKKDQLAEHYGLPVAQMTKVLKEAGLTIRKFHKPKYVLVDTEETQEDVNMEATAVENIEVETEQVQPETVQEAEAVGATNAENNEVPQGW